jgi:hypothetical protein
MGRVIGRFTKVETEASEQLASLNGVATRERDGREPEVVGRRSERLCYPKLTLCSIIVMSASWGVRAEARRRPGLQMRGHFVTQFTPFIGELGYKGGALSVEWDQAPR